MSKLQPYPSYKESGVNWLGQVPEHWDVVPCRSFMLEQVEKNEGAHIQEYLSLMAGIGVVRYEDKGDVGNKKPDDLSKCKIVSKGDFVINSMNYGIGSYGVSNYEGVCSPVYIVMQPQHEIVDEKYAFRIFENKQFQSYAQSFGNGILAHRAAINWDIIKKILVALPSREEQSTIANFLEIESVKIDTLIEKQLQLIELLKEKRQAVISKAVIKGLDDSVPMKDSGVEWLGEVPKHWNLPKIKWFCKTDSGGTPTTSKHEEYYTNGEYPWIRTTDLNNAELFEAPIYITKKALDDTACNIIPLNSVLIGMYGGAGTIGKHALLRFSATINQAVCAVTSDKRSLPEYLHYFIQFYRPYWMVGAEGTRKDPNIGQETIREAFVTLPPINEQEQIVAFLDIQTTKIDTLIEKANQAINLLKEKRTALISAVVTGKIDVRGERT